MDPVRKATGPGPAGSGARPRSMTASEQLARAFREGPSLLANMEEGFLYCRVVFEGETAVDYVYLLVNPAWERLTGLKDPIGKRVSELVPGIRETSPDLFEFYGRVARTGEPGKYETYVERLGRWLAISAHCPEEGCFAAVFRDVSERKRAEQGLREREERYRAVVETSADGVLVLDSEGRVLEANETYVRLSGYPMDELLSMRISDLEARETPEDTARHMERLKRTGSDLFETEHRTKGGLVWSAEVTTSWSPVGGGRFFAFFRDLKRRSHLESLPVPVAHLDAECRYLRVNSSYAGWFGKPVDSFPGRTVREVVGEPGWVKLKPLLERALAGEPVTFESVLPPGAEGRRRGRGLYTPDRGPDGKVRGIVVVFQEVTEDPGVAPLDRHGASSKVRGG